MGEALDEHEIVSIGNAVLELCTLPEEIIVAKMASETLGANPSRKVATKVPLPFRKNYDYGELWPQVLDDYREGKIKTIVDFVRKKNKAENKGKKKRKKSASYIAPIDSYCGSKANIEYWKELLKDSPSESVGDFIKYIKEVSCGIGERA
jgi:hypothetical protein